MRPGLTAIFATATALLLGACSSSGSSPAASPPASAPVTALGSGLITAPQTAAGSTSATTRRSRGTAGSTDWTTYHGDAARSGYAPDMPTVTTAKLITNLELDGAVYASPIVVGGTTIVATENDTVYAFDASYHQLWKRHLGTPSPAGERPCGNIDPLGITGTPVYSNGLIYLSPEYTDPARHTLVALRPASGAVAWQRSIDLPGVETVAMQQRGALTVAGGRVWVPFGGLNGDCGGYKGRLVGALPDGSGRLTDYTVPTAREAGIWTPPGPSVDANGTLFVAVGNGASGVGDAYDHSDSVLAVGSDARLRDSFSPSSWPSDNDSDLDLGSQGPALVGPWIFSAGKSGTAYVLRRTHLGGIGGQVSTAQVCTSFGGTAVVGSTVYVPCTDGVRAVRIDSAGTMHVRWHAASSIFGSPVVGGGRVWSLDPDSGKLYALNPATGATATSVAVGATSRFATPAISGRDVLVPTLAGLAVVRTS